MAENIVKLRVDSKDYDANIKSARQGLLAMEDACRKVGGTFEVVEKEEIAFVKALGKMETTSKSAKGKITELTSAFTDLKAQYARLTDAEKQSQFGKAMSKSLEELKGRIQAGNAELKSIQGELGGTGTSIESLTSKLGINIGTFAKFTTAGAAVSAAMQVCKDAFISSETNVDNWGRTVEATKSVYESFCISLNNGSLDGWFSNMDRLIQKAKDAYNAIDELNTKMTIINPERVKVQGQIQSQKEIIRTKGKDSAEGKAAAAEIKRLEPKLKDTYKQEADMNFKAFRAEVDRKLAEAGIKLDSKSKDLLMRSFSDTKAYDRIAAGAKSETRGTGRYNLDENGHAIGPEITETWKNTNQKLLDLFTDEWRTKNSGYLTAGYNAKMQSANVGIQDARYTGAGSGSGKTKQTEYTYKGIDSVVLGSIEAQEAKIKDLTELWKKAATQGVRDEYAKRIENANAELDRMKGKVPQTEQGFSGPSTAAFSAWASELQHQMATVDVTTPLYQNLQAQLADTTALQNIIGYAFQNGLSLDSINLDVENFWDKILNAKDISNADWQGITNAINKQLKALGIEPIKLNVNTGGIENLAKDAKSTGTEFQKAASAIGSVGSALQAIEDPGAKVAGIIAQAIANIALTFASSLKGTFTPWDWIAAAAAGTATMISTIAAIKSATEYHAEGGFVGSGPRGTDTVNTWLTPGELVLNASQQQNLASNLTNNGGGGGTATTTIKGEQLITVINNTRKRKGKGEIL